MRKHVIMLSLLTIFILGCSQNEERTVTEPVNSVLTQAAFKKQVESLTTNVAFKKAISDRLNTSNLKTNNQDNGALVVQNNLGLIFSFFGNGKIIFVGSSEIGTLKILPNGLAHFQVKTNGPNCVIFDTNWNLLYSNANECNEVRTGDFFCNIISAYEKFDLTFGGEILSYYYPTELQSSSVLKMNTTINNAFPVYDVVGDWISCTDATEEKNINVQYVNVGNSNANPVVQVIID